MWQRFFDQVRHATVVEPGRDVVEAVAGLGFVVVYSTTRPVSCAVQTRLWLDENGFPPGRALLCRSRGDVRAAVEVKAGHCRAVGRWLSAFVDDESEAVDALRSTGVRAHCLDALSGLEVRKLRVTLPRGHMTRCRVVGGADRGATITAVHHTAVAARWHREQIGAGPCAFGVSGSGTRAVVSAHTTARVRRRSGFLRFSRPRATPVAVTAGVRSNRLRVGEPPRRAYPARGVLR
jgi:hypothetical protein